MGISRNIGHPNRPNIGRPISPIFGEAQRLLVPFPPCQIAKTQEDTHGYQSDLTLRGGEIYRPGRHFCDAGDAERQTRLMEGAQNQQ